MPQCRTVRYEIKRARQELAQHRQDQIRERAELASRQLDLFPETAPRSPLPPPRPFGSPLVQLVFGEALIKTGLKHHDLNMIRKGWEFMKAAREQAREEAVTFPRKSGHGVMRLLPLP